MYLSLLCITLYRLDFQVTSIRYVNIYHTYLSQNTYSCIIKIRFSTNKHYLCTELHGTLKRKIPVIPKFNTIDTKSINIALKNY